MTEPTFATRADLEAWASQRATQADDEFFAEGTLNNGAGIFRAAIEDIRAVTLAHLHLPFPDDAKEPSL